jgi:Tfp pilus assembly protein PilN
MPKSQINLLPQEDFEKQPLGKFVLWALSVGRWVVIIVDIIVICAFLSRFKLDQDKANIDEKIKVKQGIIQSLQSTEKEFRSLQQRLIVIKNLQGKQSNVVPLVSTIAKVLPADVVLSNFSYQDGEIRTSGVALSEESLGRFLAGLVNSPTLTEINLSSVNQKQGDPGISFSLTAKIKTSTQKNAL